MNTPTPTPRTDAVWSATFDSEQMSAGRTARALRECSQRLEAELATLRAQLHALELVCGTTDADKFSTWVDRAIARAERAEAESDQLRDQLAAARQRETVAIASWEEERGRALREGARVVEWKARTERAEDNLAALEQCHDDNCRGVVKIADDLTAERARLDWVFRNCKVTADDFTTGNRDVYAVHDREDLGVAMKEDAK